MNPVNRILQRSLAAPFYQQHIGLLFFVFFIMFGVVDSSQLINYHLALIYAMLDSGLFLTIILAIWLFYFLKCLYFVAKKLEVPNYIFLYQMGCLPKRRSFGAFLFLYVLLFLPVTCYSIAILAVAVKSGFYLQALFIIGFQAFSAIVNAWISMHLIQRSHVSTRPHIPQIQLPFHRPLALFYLTYLSRNQKSGVLISKSFSLLSMYIVLQVMDTNSDIRVPALILLFGLTAHSFLILEMKQFEDVRLNWMRSLPVTSIRCYLDYLLTFALLLIPEMLLLGSRIGSKISPIHWLELYVFAIGFLIFLYIRLFNFVQDTDAYVRFLLWVFLGTFLTILYNIVPILSAAFLTVSYILFQKRRYDYEPVSKF